MSRIKILSPMLIIGLLIIACSIFPSQSSQSPVAPAATETKFVLISETPVTTETPVISEAAAFTQTPAYTSTPDFYPGTQVIQLDELRESIPWLSYNPAYVPVTYYYGFNIKKKPFDDVLVRKALAMAVDRGAIVSLAKSISGYDAKPATSFTPPDVITRNLYGEIGLNYDPDEARQMLSMTGYGNRSDFPEITIYHFGELHDRKIAEAVANMWESELGISVSLRSENNLREFQERLAINPPGVVPLGWFADINDPDNFLRELFGLNGSYYGNFHNQEFDQLVELAAQIKDDPASRLDLYIQAERILCDQDAVVIPLYHYHIPE